MEISLDFAISSYIFWVIMIILDMIIAFYIPVSRIIKRLKSKKTINMITKRYGVGLYDKLRPRLQEDVDGLINSIESRVKNNIEINVNNATTAINKRLDEAITNDIPHIVEERIRPIEDNLNTQVDKMGFNLAQSLQTGLTPLVMEMQEIKSKVMQNLALRNTSQSREEKNQKRQILEMMIYSKEPNFAKLLDAGKAAMALGELSKGEYNHYLDMIAKFVEMKHGSKDGTLSLLQAGSYLQAIPAMQAKGERGQENMGQVLDMSDESMINYVKSQMLEGGVPEKVLNSAIAKGKKVKLEEKKIQIANSEKEKEGGNKTNGKEEK